MDKRKIFFLPFWYKPAGYVLFALGIGWWFIIEHFNVVLQTPVFAFISSYVSTSFFSVVKTNISDEICLVLTLVGSLFIMFSKEKEESPTTEIIKYRTLFEALLINQAILIFSTLFLYGTAFITIVLANLVMLNVIYVILLKIRAIKSKRKV